MTAGPSIDPARFLQEELAEASPDLMRELLTTFVNALLSAQADSVCGAEYGARSQERVNRRNGYRIRDLDTRVGTVEVAIPKLREGSFFPDWLTHKSCSCPRSCVGAEVGRTPAGPQARSGPYLSASGNPPPAATPGGNPAARPALPHRPHRRGYKASDVERVGPRFERRRDHSLWALRMTRPSLS
jgi:hypothetical protein